MAHVYVHFNTTANPYIYVTVPRLAVALRSASSSGALLDVCFFFFLLFFEKCLVLFMIVVLLDCY